MVDELRSASTAMAMLAAQAQSPSPEPLIPGLPDDVSEQCLLRLPPPYHPPARCVSAEWNRVLSSPSFRRRRSGVAGVCRPFVFVLAVDAHARRRPQWHCLDPDEGAWFALPPMPLRPEADTACCAGVAVAGDDGRKSIHVLGGMIVGADNQTMALDAHFVFRADTNSWTTGAPLPTPRWHFSAGALAGGLIAVAGGGDGVTSADVYDANADAWAAASPMRRSFARYDSTVAGGRLYITEGWTWPCDVRPSSAVYDAPGDTWTEIPRGMLDGWVGAAVAVGGGVYTVADYGDGKVKVYDECSDKWRSVGGNGALLSVKKPFAVAGSAAGGEERKLYVVGAGLDVAIGSVAKEAVEWRTVNGPPAAEGMSPSHAVVLHL